MCCNYFLEITLKVIYAARGVMCECVIVAVLFLAVLEWVWKIKLIRENGQRTL